MREATSSAAVSATEGAVGIAELHGRYQSSGLFEQVRHVDSLPYDPLGTRAARGAPLPPVGMGYGIILFAVLSFSFS